MKLTLVQLMAIMQVANHADTVFATALSVNLDMGTERHANSAAGILRIAEVTHTQEGRYIRFREEHIG